MDFPGSWRLSTSAEAIDESKRNVSPGSFFFGQGTAIVQAAEYFKDERLEVLWRGATASSHRHRIHLALFGQLMASFEYMTKEVVARAVDIFEHLDKKFEKCDWAKVTASHVLATRNAPSTPGSTLINPTQSWHQASTINERHRHFFGQNPIDTPFIKDLDTLWLIRHTVAHNAGRVTTHDASRMDMMELAGQVIDINETFITSSFDFLTPIAERMVKNAEKELLTLLREKDIAINGGLNWTRDQEKYSAIKQLGAFVTSRGRDLPVFTQQNYEADCTPPAVSPIEQPQSIEIA